MTYGMRNGDNVILSVKGKCNIIGIIIIFKKLSKRNRRIHQNVHRAYP